MPPKAKFTKEEITQAALNIVKWEKISGICCFCRRILSSVPAGGFSFCDCRIVFLTLSFSDGLFDGRAAARQRFFAACSRIIYLCVCRIQRKIPLDGKLVL